MKKRFNGNRKGLSAIVATLIIILLTLVAVGIVWVVVRNLIQGGTEQIELGQYTLDLEIKSAQVQANNVTVVVVKRNSGAGEFIGLNFVFSDGQNSESIRRDVVLKEQELQSFTFTLSRFSAENLKTITVVPILLLSSGRESMGSAAVTYDYKSGTSTSNSTGTTGTGNVVGNFAKLGYSGVDIKEYTYVPEINKTVQFSKTIIDPLDVLPGQNQTFTVYVSSPNGISTVTSVTQLDNTVLNLDFIKTGTDNGYEVWSASWIVNDTHTETYRTNVTAMDSFGNTNSIVLTWTDSCQGQITHGASTSTLTLGCTTGVNSIGGKDGGGNIVIDGVTITIDSGSKFIFNQGSSISMQGGGRIVSTSTGSFGNGYLYYKDTDGDTRSINTTLWYSSSSTLAGHVRASSATTTADCDDGNINVYQNLTCYTDGDSDGVTGSSTAIVCSAAACAAPYTTNSENDCNDGNINVYQTMSCYANADGDSFFSDSTTSQCTGATCEAGGFSSDPGGDCNDAVATQPVPDACA